MKCVQLNNGDKIRVSDLEAYKLVDVQKEGVYINKTLFKAE